MGAPLAPRLQERQRQTRWVATTAVWGRACPRVDEENQKEGSKPIWGRAKAKLSPMTSGSSRGKSKL